MQSPAKQTSIHCVSSHQSCTCAVAGVTVRIAVYALPISKPNMTVNSHFEVLGLMFFCASSALVREFTCTET